MAKSDDDDIYDDGGRDGQERVLESERRKRCIDEMRDTEARRHSDHLKYVLSRHFTDFTDLSFISNRT